MHDTDWLAERFEEQRPRLTGVARRMLGSASEADDAVQEAWLRLSRTDAEAIDNLGSWLTTVLARVCLNVLQSRRVRSEVPLDGDLSEPAADPGEAADPEQEALLAESVGLALLVVLDALSPAERVAFVLHDMFGVPFEEIAPIVGRNQAAARQLASRARRRVRREDASGEADRVRQAKLVEAFLAAARDGEFERLLGLLAPDVVLTADASAARIGVPRGHVAPQTIVDWVRSDGLAFPPGTRYAYSNTDNIVVGLLAEAVTGRPYGRLLDELVLRPGRLRQTSFPATVTLPSPFIHGYLVGAGPRPVDVSTILSPSGAWASGAIVSTPRELARFIRLDLGRTFFGAAQQREQLRFVRGASSPPGPGANAAGLAIFRYTTRCGVVYGHTGNFPGYTQWAAATADGRRSVTTSLNIPAPDGALLRRLRALQTAAVCALLGR